MGFPLIENHQKGNWKTAFTGNTDKYYTHVYHYGIVTDMSNHYVRLDEESSKVLAAQPNKSAYVREAIKVYHSDILTGVEGIKQVFRVLKANQDEHFAYYDRCFKQLEELMQVMKLAPPEFKDTEVTYDDPADDPTMTTWEELGL